jgi:Mpv17 / PMP22 family
VQSCEQVKGKYQRALVQLAVDQTAGSVLINAGFYIFYILLTSAIDGPPPLGIGSAVQTKLTTEMWPMLKNNWKLWPAANFINFAFVPPHLRLLFSNVVAVGWNSWLSNSVTS